MAKTTCPISRSEFNQHATADQGREILAGLASLVRPQEFSTGSFGFAVPGGTRTSITVNGKRLEVMVGVNLTIIGSKEAPVGDVKPAGMPAVAPAGRKAS